MKIALVHDHLTQEGGAEKVLEVLQQTFPTSPTYTLVYNAKKTGALFGNREIKTSFLQKMPFSRKKIEWYLPLMPAATESHNLDNFNVILSSSSAFAKGIISKPETLHICYCHTPTRYLWSDSHSYLQELNKPKIIKKLLPLFLSKIRQWDSQAASRVDYFIANSREVQKRIKKYYRQDSVVIYPPVETSKFSPKNKVSDYFLTGGRLVSYKKFDLTINAFNRLGIKLKIFGQGPDYKKLRQQARSNIEFLGPITDQEKKEVFESCLAFINPQTEDFGITTVEAMAAGRPVIAYNKGGALETVIDGKTGTFFDEQEWEVLADKIFHFKPENFNPQIIHDHAKQFDTEVFKKKITDFITEKTNNLIF
jgi:glycosyltransferase involved in cell wall biosynthesis